MAISGRKYWSATNLLFFKKLNKITKLYLSDVKCHADSKYVLKILIFCLVSEISAILCW